MVFRAAVLLLLISASLEFNFDKTIVAIHFPFYKIMLSIGDCKNHTLFTEQQIWAALKLNRVLDIYYNSNDSYYLVSMVEINLVVNNTEFKAKAYTDVGSPYFRAHIIFPIQTGSTFYRINIYTCNPKKDPEESSEKAEGISDEEDLEPLSHMPFYMNKKMPVWEQLLGYEEPTDYE